MGIIGIKKGNITFDFSDNKGILIIDLGHKLSNYERLQVLKEIINFKYRKGNVCLHTPFFEL